MSRRPAESGAATSAQRGREVTGAVRESGSVKEYDYLGERDCLERLPHRKVFYWNETRMTLQAHITHIISQYHKGISS